MIKVIYARVSTDKQSHDSQLLELKEYCERRGWGNAMTITDTISGSKVTRKGLDELMCLVRKGKVDTIICYKLDRLGRSLAHLAQIIGELMSNNVALVIPSQGIDTSSSNPAARLQLNILCAVAEFERDIIRERVNAGLSAAKARGVRLGRPCRLQVDRSDLLTLKEGGHSVRQIAAHVGASSSYVQKLLKTAS